MTLLLMAETRVGLFMDVVVLLVVRLWCLPLVTIDQNLDSIGQGTSWMGFEAEDYGKLGGMESTSTLFEKVVPIRVTKGNAEDRW